jgi:hypothetical protein
VAVGVASVWTIAVALCLWPGAASAATVFHVAPGGSGGACSVAQPCNIVFALQSAGSGDTVMAAGNQGTYGLPNSPTAAPIEVPGGATLEGEPGQPQPQLYTEAAGFASVILETGGSLIDFGVHEAKFGQTAVFGDGSNTVERVLSLGGSGIGCVISPNSTITDSACSGGYGAYDSLGASGQTFTLNLRNDTFYGTQQGALFAGNHIVFLIEAVNTIFLGQSGGVRVMDQTEGTIEVAAANSSYSGTIEENGATMTPEGTAGNQTAAPLLVDPAAGDFHELAGSPTIDAALASPANGEFDLDGNARTLPSVATCAGTGAAVPDIGAYEYVPPSPSCGPSGPSSGPSGPSSPSASSATAGPTTPSPHAHGRAGARIAAVRVSGADVSLKFVAVGGATRFRCRLDRSSWRSCHSPVRYRNLAPGPHRISVKAVGPAGDSFAKPAKRRFDVPVAG